MNSIKTKLIAYFGIIIIVSSVVIGSLGFLSSAKGMRGIQSRMLTDKLEGDIESASYYFKNFYGSVSQSNETLYDIRGKNIYGRHEMVDTLLEDLGDVATIFSKVGDDFKSISSNVMLDNEERAEGTFLGTDSKAYEAIMKGETYIGEANILGEDYYTAYRPIKNTSDEVIGLLFVGTSITASKRFIKAYGGKVGQTISLIVSLSLILGIASAALVGKNLTNPIIFISKEIGKIAEYDLTIDENSGLEILASRKDEIGSIAKSVRDLQYNFTDLIRNVSDTSHHVATSSAELSATSEQSSLASDEVARAIDEIARGASDQALDTEKAAVKADEIGDLINTNEIHISELNTSAVDIDKQKEEGFYILHELVKKTEESEKATKEIFEIIKGTNKNAHRIENASVMIQNIADQTNLLALNAAIEAARAGEAGRGFAVVADEIRKLAEESNGFTKEINTIINELKSTTEQAVTTMEVVGRIGSEQTKGVRDTREKFKMIAFAIENTRKNIKNLGLSEGEISTKIDELIGIIQNLSAVAEENAAGTEQSSAAIEEQTAGMEEIANSSEQLAGLAEELNELIDRFKI